MAEIPVWLLPHTVVVKTFRGSTGMGDTWDDATPVDQLQVDETRRLVRNDRGDEVVSQATIRGRLARAPLFPPGSIVEVNGRTATVIGCHPHTDGNAGGWQHVEVTLT